MQRLHLPPPCIRSCSKDNMKVGQNVEGMIEKEGTSMLYEWFGQSRSNERYSSMLTLLTMG
jgi:hypothetical protein